MKSERRHELQTNILADWAGRKLQQIQPYSMVILGVTVVVIAAVAALFLVTQNAGSSPEWNAYYAAREVNEEEEFRKVAEAQPNTAAGLWARQSAADHALEQGSQDLFRDREQGLAALARARDDYKLVLEKGGNDPMLRERAAIGLAQTYEALGKLPEAISEYEKLSAGTGPFAEAAAHRAAYLKRADIQDFYAWFEKQEPRTPPQDGQPFNPHGAAPGGSFGLEGLGQPGGAPAGGPAGGSTEAEQEKPVELPGTGTTPGEPPARDPRLDSEFKPSEEETPSSDPTASDAPEAEAPAEEPAAEPAGDAPEAEAPEAPAPEAPAEEPASEEPAADEPAEDGAAAAQP